MVKRIGRMIFFFLILRVFFKKVSIVKCLHLSHTVKLQVHIEHDIILLMDLVTVDILATHRA